MNIEMTDIEFKFIVPTESESVYLQGSYSEIEFAQLGECDVFQAHYDCDFEKNSTLENVCVSAELTIDRGCLSETNARGVGRTGVLLLCSFNATVAVRNVPDNIATGINQGVVEDERIAGLCNHIGIVAAKAALTGKERLIRYANEKRQIFPVATAIDDNAAFRLLINPNTTLSITGELGKSWRTVSFNGCTKGQSAGVTVTLPTSSEVISKCDFEQLRNFIENNKRIYSPNSFLVNAHRLWHIGEYRSSVLESYSAIEVSIVRLNNLPSYLGEKLPHIDADKFSKDRKEFGITKTIKYIIPLAYPEIMNEGGLLERVIELGQLRQKVSHDGKHNFEKNRIRKLIVSAEKFCDFLRGRHMP